MDQVKILEVKESILGNNDLEAKELRSLLNKKKIFLLNLMSSPGSGKTSTLIKLINILKKDFKIGVMEADIDSDVDALTIQKETGVKAIQLHTGGMCHLDASMTKQGLEAINYEEFDFIVLENIGNLVCPAEFDTGAQVNMTILSVPEGDDKPSKYPLIYEVSDLVVINKIDVLPVFDFDITKSKERIKLDNPNADILLISAKTGEGVNELASWIKNKIESIKKGE